MNDIDGAVGLTDKGRDWLIEKARRYLGAPEGTQPAGMLAKLIEDLDSFATVSGGIDATTKDGTMVRLAVKINPST